MVGRGRRDARSAVDSPAAAQAAVAIVTVGSGRAVGAVAALRLTVIPKQDYVEAVTFVERSRQPADAIVVIGDAAEIPVARYLGRPWPRVHSAAELRARKRADGAVWVVSTFASDRVGTTGSLARAAA